MEQQASGMNSAPGSMGEMADREGKSGFPMTDAGAVSGQGGFSQPNERDAGATQGTPPNNSR